MYKPTVELDSNALIHTAQGLKAIAHPVRLAIVGLLEGGESLSVTEIYESLGLEQAVASQHLAVLRERKILDASRQGKHTYYSLRHDCITDIIELMLSTLENKKR
ncbi:MAG: metalloregulator ArsR/SmtB family transcription factor [Bacteroidia bacterium]